MGILATALIIFFSPRVYFEHRSNQYLMSIFSCKKKSIALYLLVYLMVCSIAKNVFLLYFFLSNFLEQNKKNINCLLNKYGN